MTQKISEEMQTHLNREADAVLNLGLFCAPIFCTNETGYQHSATVFFIEYNDKPYAITAKHVPDILHSTQYRTYISELAVNLQEREVYSCDKKDFFIFKITYEELKLLNKRTFSSGIDNSQESDQITLFGFPENETETTHHEINFHGCVLQGIVSSVNDRDISYHFEREYCIGVNNLKIPSSDFNYSGMSGGPVFVTKKFGSLFLYKLTGFIYQGPNNEDGIEGFECFKIKRLDKIIAEINHLL